MRWAILTAGAALLAGCGYGGAKDLPLPGAIGGADTYRVTVVFDDATNLVVKETCRSNDTVIGSVESINLDGNLKARVVCRIKDSVRLPANAVATLRETSLLGERFIALDPPVGARPQGQLARSSTLPAASTRVDADAEMVLGALSQVLNGGSLGSVETISRELTVALHRSDVGDTVRSLDSVTQTLNTHRNDITSSLDSLDRLTTELEQQRDVIAEALDTIPAGLDVLDRQRPRLVATLRHLTKLSKVLVPLIDDTRADTVADLEHLRPVLSELAKEADEVALTLERVVRFPFSSNATSMIQGDYGGLQGTVDLDLDSLNEILKGQANQTGAASLAQPKGSAKPTDSAPRLPLIPEVPNLLESLTGTKNSKPDGLIGHLLGGLLGDRP